MYADLGFNVNPFSIGFADEQSAYSLAYKNNFGPTLGLGYAHNRIHIRLGFPVIGNLRPADKYGKTKQFNFAYDIVFKRIWYDLQFKSTFGFALKTPNELLSDTYSLNATLNACYFKNPDFAVNGLFGKFTTNNKEILTLYLKGTINYFGSTNKAGPLIPIPLQVQENSITSLTSLNAFDFGAIPGLAYVNKIKNWQFGGWLGLGPVLQFKGYATPSYTKLNMGIAPRMDLRFLGGYTTNEKSFYIVTDFDNKTIRFGDFNYRQVYYALKFVAAYRFVEK